MPTNNATIISNIFLQGTNDYQQRVPDPSQSTIAQTAAFLFDPLNRRYLNEFVDTLVNRIGLSYVHQQEFNNPLATFKRDRLNYGSTIQEMQVGWIRAHSYNADEESLLKLHRPDVAVAYHTVNRQDYYPISIGYDLLRQAFVDEYGLNNLIAGIMAAPKNSDEYDEFNIMKELFKLYNDDYGFFNQQITANPGTNPDVFAKELLRQVKTYSGIFKFPASTYSTINKPFGEYPVFARPDELIFITTPQVNALLDVDAYAALFNVDRAEVPARVVEVDQLPIDGAYGILTTRDFFVCADNLYQMGETFYNPQTLTTNTYLHHWGVYSVSPFVPAVLFSTSDTTNTMVIKAVYNESGCYLIEPSEPEEPIEFSPDGGLQLYENTVYYIDYASLFTYVDGNGDTIDPVEMGIDLKSLFKDYIAFADVIGSLWYKDENEVDSYLRVPIPDDVVSVDVRTGKVKIGNVSKWAIEMVGGFEYDILGEYAEVRIQLVPNRDYDAIDIDNMPDTIIGAFNVLLYESENNG